MLLNIFFAFIIIVFTFIISKILSSKVSGFIEKNDTDGNKVELSGVITRTISITILIIGFTITLSILGIDMGIFLGGFGFGLGFTLKIFLSNFIGGIIMVTQGSYHNGDLIKIGEKMGNIVKINSLFTEVKQFDGVIFYIPNIVS
ncbi:MAG: mechanosensitive ion channel [Candidatus Gracilibacteria bacterium]|nr:mechanosensitive ion channel [Candidatus Gracilibacteria bacterium]